MKRRISILGATGSIGTSTLDLIGRSAERFEVIAVTAATNTDGLAEIAMRTRAKLAVIADEARYFDLQQALAGTDCRVAAGKAGLIEAATCDSDLVVAAIVGCAGLTPVMAAIEAGKTIGLANKEALVTAGALMMRAARRSGSTILPVDSEHNAIFQCLAGSSKDDVEKLILTASGGPFRTASAATIEAATPAQAVAHPNWSMGAKISVDSATLMNKGLELIEAALLFDLPSSSVEILVHPQSVIHSMVAFVDGSVLAQLGSPDMRVPISYVLAWPERMPSPAQRLDLVALGKLEFEAPDFDRFPALTLARQALEQGGAAPTVLNAANELAVASFLAGTIRFTDIASIVADALSQADFLEPSSIEDVLAIDAETRERVGSNMKTVCH